MQPIYRSDGEWVAVYDQGHLFNVDGEWLGFVVGRDLFDPMGRYVGFLSNDRRLLRQRTAKTDPPVASPQNGRYAPSFPPMSPWLPCSLPYPIALLIYLKRIQSGLSTFQTPALIWSRYTWKEKDPKSRG